MNIHGQKARRAVQWISDTLQDTESNLNELVHEAIAKFDLDPRQAEDLIHFYKRSQENQH